MNHHESRRRARFAAWMLLACLTTMGRPGVGQPSVADSATEVSDLSRTERLQLQRGQLVTRPMRFGTTRDGQEYVGGVGYHIVDASPQEVLSALRRPGALRRALPFTLSAHHLDEEGGVTRVALAQGKGPIVARYTVALHWDPADFEARFWLDPSETHDLDDIWGFVRIIPLPDGRSVVAFAVAFDLGSSAVKAMFDTGVQRAALATPRRIRDYVEGI